MDGVVSLMEVAEKSFLHGTLGLVRSSGGHNGKVEICEVGVQKGYGAIQPDVWLARLLLLLVSGYR